MTEPPTPPPDSPPAPAPGPNDPQAPARGKRNRLLQILATGVVVAVVLVGGYFVRQAFDGNERADANPGSCVQVVKAEASSPEIKIVECGAAEGAFKVAKKLGSSTAACPLGDYLSYVEQNSRGSFTLCLMPNTKQGECLTDVGSAGMSKVTCAPGTFKVTSVVEGRSDAEACGDDTPLVYPEPATTICTKGFGG